MSQALYISKAALSDYRECGFIFSRMLFIIVLNEP